jgi:acyl-CoA thioesterase I
MALLRFSSMSRIAMYFASGESLYLGAGLLLLAVLSPAFLKHPWMSRVRNFLAWIGLALMIMACPPVPLVVSLMFLGVCGLWFITSNQTSLSKTTFNLQTGARILLAAFLLILTVLEFSHREMPRITGNASDHLVVIGDSISSRIDRRVASWPLVLQQTCGVPVKNLARPGALVSEALLMAGDVTDDDYLVVVEIGGNDLPTGVSADDYSKALDALLSRISAPAPNRTVVMFELPLLPTEVAYEQIQRRLCAKYDVALIPKRYLAQVLGDTSATTDGLHLSASGAHRVWRDSSRAFIASLELLSVVGPTIRRRLRPAPRAQSLKEPDPN